MSDTQKHTKSNVPNLRFPEFDNNWHSISLDELAPGIASGRSKASVGSYALIGSTGIIGTTSKAEYSGKLILVARVGANAGFINYFEGTYGITDNTLIVKTKDQDEDFCKYIYYYLNHENLNKLVFGSGQPLITGGMLKRVKVFLGGHKEISKISLFLSLIDERISIQNKVIEKYESLIKALAYETIGKHVPNVTLSECVQCSSSSIKESELAAEGTVSAYGASGVSGFMEIALNEGDSILITKDGSGVGSLRYVSGPHSFVGTLNSMTPKEGVYLPYIYYALQNVCFESYRTGQAIPHIYFKDYGKAAVFCPSFDDQKRLAIGLEMIDAKIGTERAALQNLKLAKAYFLSALFI